MAPAPDGSTDGNIIRPPRGDAATRDAATPDAGLDAGLDAAIVDGSIDAAVDSGRPDVGLRRGCFLAGAGTGNDAVIEAGGESVPFAVSRSYATWDGARCSVPTLVIGLTAGSCIPSIGESLSFSIRRDAIGTTIFTGEHLIGEEPDDLGLTVRFTKLDEQWGTCLGSGPSGSVNFTQVDSLVGSRLTASFSLTLGDCRDPFTSLPVEVTGTFDVPLEVAFASVCL